MVDPIGLLKSFFLVSLVFIPLERLVALKRDQKIFRTGWRTDVSHVMLTGIAVQLANVLFIVLIAEAIHQAVPQGLHTSIANQPLWLQYLEILIIADLGSYAMHRAFHEVPWLWRFHAVHHSSEQLDYLASFRVHPFDQFMVSSVTFIPVMSLNFNDAAIAVFIISYHWHAMLLHSNTRLRFGWLEKIVATPAFHHWHHTKNGPIDRNFAGQLAIFDKIFGTYLDTRDQVSQTPKSYGITDPMPDNYFGQLVYPFRKDNTAPATMAANTQQQTEQA